LFGGITDKTKQHRLNVLHCVCGKENVWRASPAPSRGMHHGLERLLKAAVSSNTKALDGTAVRLL
jgi:hypothetical protein